MSLVAAVPGGILAFLLVMAFLSHADDMGGTLNGIVGFTLLCSVAAALMPVGIMLFGGPKGATKPKPAKEKTDADEGDDSKAAADEFGDSDDSSDLLESGDSDASGELMEADDDDSSGEHELSDEWDTSDADLSDEFEFDDALSGDDLELDFEDEEK